MISIKLPIIGNNECAIVRAIFVESGRHVNKDELIFEVEIAKTIVDIYSDYDGVVTHDNYPGKKINVHEKLCSISTVKCNPIESEISIECGQLMSKKPAFDVHAYTSRKASENLNLFPDSRGFNNASVSVIIETSGVRLIPPPFLFKDSISDLIVYEAARLFKKYPNLNASYVNSNSYITYKNVNFGWGFDNGENLKVLNLRSAEKKSLVEIQEGVYEMLRAYEEHEKIDLDLMTGSTVTLSDLSKSGMVGMFPLLNGEQSLILGVTKVSKDKYQIIGVHDHRVTEGLAVSRFLSDLKKKISLHFDGFKSNLICSACEKKISDEVGLGNRGLIRMIGSNGDEISICRNCFDGY